MNSIQLLRMLREDPKKLPEQADRDLVETLLPELKGSKDARDHVRLATATEIVRRWRLEFMRTLEDAFKSFREDAQKGKDLVGDARSALSASNIRIQELQGELKAAQEGRGAYESKRVKELEQKLAAKDREITNLRDTVENRDNTIRGLLSELEGQKHALAGYERDITHLTTAATKANEQHQKEKQELDKLIREAREKLSNARDNLFVRYGTTAPAFMEAVRNDIVAALTKLPPQA